MDNYSNSKPFLDGDETLKDTIMPKGYELLSEFVSESLPETTTLKSCSNNSHDTYNQQYALVGNQPYQTNNIVQSPLPVSTPAPVPIKTVFSQNNTSDTSNFRIEYNDLEPAMYICENSIQNNVKGTEEVTDFYQQKVARNMNNSINYKRKPLSSGCAQFNNLIEQISELKKENLCEIRITSKSTTTVQRFPIKDIFQQSKSVKETLASCGVCFLNNKCFKMWCVDIARHVNNSNITTKERSGFYKENGVWHSTEINRQDPCVSEITKAINSLTERFEKSEKDVFEDLTLILCGIIGKIFTVLKQEEISDIANVILISSDIYKAENDLKNFFGTTDNEIFDDSGKCLKAFKSCTNTIPLIVLSDKVSQNKYALENIAKAKDLNSFPLILAENKDNLAKINGTKHFVTIRYNCLSNSDIRITIDLFYRQLFSKNNLFEQINKYMGLYLQLFSNSGTNIMFKVQNLYSLLLSLVHIILSDFQVSNIPLICDHYFEYLTSEDTKQDVAIDKLKYILTSDLNFKRVNKKTAESLDDNFLYYSDKSIYLSSTTLTHIAEQFGFSNVNKFSEILNDNELLTTSKGTTMNVVNIRGKSVRGYTLDINSIFKQGDFIPRCTEYETPEYSIPIGLIDFDRSINFAIDETENNMMYISGKSRSGKTNFCNVLSTQAVMKHMSVVMIGNSKSIVDLGPNAKEYVINDLTMPIAWKEIDRQGQITKVTVSNGASISVNDILNSFLNDHKFLQKADEKVFTLLVLDEVSEFSWDEKTPIRELLRKGSKYGISALLSTQYLNSKNGANMNDALKQCSSFCFFEDADIPAHLSKKHPELNDCVQDLNKYESILIGNFTVDNVPIKNPLRFKTYKL